LSAASTNPNPPDRTFPPEFINRLDKIVVFSPGIRNDLRGRRFPSYDFREPANSQDYRTAGQPQPCCGDRRDSVLGLHLGIDRDTSGRALDRIDKHSRRCASLSRDDRQPKLRSARRPFFPGKHSPTEAGTRMALNGANQLCVQESIPVRSRTS